MLRTPATVRLVRAIQIAMLADLQDLRSWDDYLSLKWGPEGHSLNVDEKLAWAPVFPA